MISNVESENIFKKVGPFLGRVEAMDLMRDMPDDDTIVKGSKRGAYHYVSRVKRLNHNPIAYANAMRERLAQRKATTSVAESGRGGPPLREGHRHAA
jgi:hypothetical protein